MTNKTNLTKEERLAQQLRLNLLKRKQKARLQAENKNEIESQNHENAKNKSIF